MWHNFRFIFYLLMGLCALMIVSEYNSRNQRKYSKTTQLQVKQLVDQAAQLAVQSQQDSNPMIALIHITQAEAMLTTVATLVHSEDLPKLAQVEYDKLYQHIDIQKDKTTKRFLEEFPTATPDHVLSTIARYQIPN